MSKFIAANPDTVVPQDLLSRIPPERRAQIAKQENEIFLPGRRKMGDCRVCGRHTSMTREHVPPRGAFNNRTVKSLAVSDTFFAGLDDSRPSQSQGGVAAYVLCERCNNFTGTNWASEYVAWTRALAHQLTECASIVEEAMSSDDVRTLSVSIDRARPGRFVRQALTMLLVLSGDAQMCEQEPAIAQLVSGGAEAALPPPFRIGLWVCPGPFVRHIGGRWGQQIYRAASDSVTYVIDLAAPPLAIEFTLDGPPINADSLDITDYVELPVDEELNLDLELPIGFSLTPYPADYRSPRALNGDANGSSLAR